MGGGRDCDCATQGCLLDCAEELKVIQRKGAWYSYGETRLGQGREKAVVYLQEDPELQRYVTPRVY